MYSNNRRDINAKINKIGTKIIFLFFNKKFSSSTKLNQTNLQKNFNYFLKTLFFIFIIFRSQNPFIFWSKARINYYINNWIYTTNHKRIAVNYFWFVILSGIVGMVLATVIRLEFAYPGVGVLAGDSIQYLSLASAHGVIMVFFMIMPLLFGAFANFLLPTQLGVHDVAFPRLNSAAFWFLPGGLLMLCQLVCVDRRYQRMNCFNIREVESLLKRKFFTDLVDSNDYRNLLNKTSIGMRFKLNSVNYLNSNIQISNFYGFKSNAFSKFQTYSLPCSLNKNESYYFFKENFFFSKIFFWSLTSNLINFNFFTYLNNFFFYLISTNWYFSNYNYFFINFQIKLFFFIFNIENAVDVILSKFFSVFNPLFFFSDIFSFFKHFYFFLFNFFF